MTDTELDRLPESLKRIVVADRALHTWRGQAVVPFEELRENRDERRRCREAAHQVWGYRLGGDDSTARG